jgi:hypothetical protein
MSLFLAHARNFVKQKNGSRLSKRETQKLSCTICC